MIQRVSEKNGVKLIALEGNLELSKQARLKEDLYKSIQQGETKDSNVILDFKGVEFIDSACLGVLIGLARSVRKVGGDIRLTSLHDEVRSIFQITRLDKVFKIFDKLEEAVASYSS